MSVYIRGMEMPSNCFECRFAVDGWCYAAEKQDNRDYLRETHRANWCPLIEVPPHGRLIDADEFLSRALGTKCFRGDYALMLQELVGESMTIIPADKEVENPDFFCAAGE